MQLNKPQFVHPSASGRLKETTTSQLQSGFCLLFVFSLFLFFFFPTGPGIKGTGRERCTLVVCVCDIVYVCEQTRSQNGIRLKAMPTSRDAWQIGCPPCDETEAAVGRERRKRRRRGRPWVGLNGLNQNRGLSSTH